MVDQSIFLHFYLPVRSQKIETRIKGHNDFCSKPPGTDKYLNNVKPDVVIWLTWKRGQDAGVGTRFLWVLGRIFGLEGLVKAEKFSVPSVDEILTPSFSLHFNHKPLGETEMETQLSLCLGSVSSMFLLITYKVVNEALLLFSISDDGADRHIRRQLIKVTE